MCDNFDVFLIGLHRKDLCEAKHKTPSMFKFSDVLLHLSQTDPPVEASHGQEWY